MVAHREQSRGQNPAYRPFGNFSLRTYLFTMATGWARDGAVQDQIDDSIKDAIAGARAGLPAGESATHCIVCNEPIAERRRDALPGVRTCVSCQAERDARPAFSAINRRGSKDSQLR